LRAAAALGYPVILKSTAGVAGSGWRWSTTPTVTGRLRPQSPARAGQLRGGSVYLERFVPRARHIEVQIFGDRAGGVTVLGERDCSARGAPEGDRGDAGSRPVGRAAGRGPRGGGHAGPVGAYRSADGGVVLDSTGASWSFLEMNTRLQVCSTAYRGGDRIDLGVDGPAGRRDAVVPVRAGPRRSGPPCEVRPPVRSGTPSSADLRRGPGQCVSAQRRLLNRGLVAGRPPGRLRSGRGGGRRGRRAVRHLDRGRPLLSAHYDPMLAKLIAHGGHPGGGAGPDGGGGRASRIAGIETNLEYLGQVWPRRSSPPARGADPTLTEFDYRPSTIEVLAGRPDDHGPGPPGASATGPSASPPSGPMDDLSLPARQAGPGNANRPASELTVSGPTLRFHRQRRSA